MSDYNEKVAAYREAITNAVCYGITYSIEQINDHALRNPGTELVCAELAATLRQHCEAIRRPQ